MSDLTGLVDLFLTARRPVVFTGAGVSTESGIPDFRSPGGVWDRYKPIDFRDFMRDPEARRETWRRGLQTYPLLAAARPNAAHQAIAELERLDRLTLLITQNIDGLHSRAGSSRDRLVELHGNAHGVRCLDCAADYEREEVHQRVLAGEDEPPCLACGGWLKPSTVSFGEPLPIEALQRAERATRECDLFMVVGSSLVVYPAAALPELALQRGTPLAIVNASPTHLDNAASFRCDQPAGQALATLIELLRPRLLAGQR